MKKTLSRFLCALLVVAMVCAMAPAALAADTSVSVDPQTVSLDIGKTTQLSATVTTVATENGVT